MAGAPYYRPHAREPEPVQESPAQAALRALLVGGASFIPQAAGALLSTSLKPGGTLGDALSSGASLQQRADKSASEAALKTGQADYYSGVNPTALARSRMTQQTAERGQDFSKETQQRGQDMTLEGQQLAADRDLASKEFSQFTTTPETASARGWGPGAKRPVRSLGGGGGGGGTIKTTQVDPNKVFLKLPGGKLVPFAMGQSFIRGEQSALSAVLRATGGNYVTNAGENLDTADGRAAWWQNHTQPAVAIQQTDRRGNVKTFYQDIDRSQLANIDVNAPGGPEDNRPGPTLGGQPGQARGPGDTLRVDSLYPPQLNPPEVVDLRGAQGDVRDPLDQYSPQDTAEVVDLRGTRQPTRPPGFVAPTLGESPAAKAAREGRAAEGDANRGLKASEGDANRANRLQVAQTRAQQAVPRMTPTQQARTSAALMKIREGVSGETKGMMASGRQRGSDAKLEGERELDAVLAEVDAQAAAQGGGAPAPAPAPAPVAAQAPAQAAGPTAEQTQAGIAAGRRDANIRKWANHYGIPIPGE